MKAIREMQLWQNNDGRRYGVAITDDNTYSGVYGKLKILGPNTENSVFPTGFQEARTFCSWQLVIPVFIIGSSMTNGTKLYIDVFIKCRRPSHYRFQSNSNDFNYVVEFNTSLYCRKYVGVDRRFKHNYNRRSESFELQTLTDTSVNTAKNMKLHCEQIALMLELMQNITNKPLVLKNPENSHRSYKNLIDEMTNPFYRRITGYISKYNKEIIERRKK